HSSSTSREGLDGAMEDPASDLERRLEQAERELTESREQQAATAEVLRVISSSPGELEPVFSAILQNALRLCEAEFGNLLRHSNKAFHAAHSSTHRQPSRRLFGGSGSASPRKRSRTHCPN